MKRIGFLINPVAGMGGAVGLKGTDGQVAEALLRGATPQAKNRAKITLHHVKNNQDLIFFTPSGAMGEDALRETGVQHIEVVTHAGNQSTAQDTKIAVQRFFELGVDLILFCGGDGTARDIFDVVGTECADPWNSGRCEDVLGSLCDRSIHCSKSCGDAWCTIISGFRSDGCG